MWILDFICIKAIPNEANLTELFEKQFNDFSMFFFDFHLLVQTYLLA
jgi:hypothetical protein